MLVDEEDGDVAPRREVLERGLYRCRLRLCSSAKRRGVGEQRRGARGGQGRTRATGQGRAGRGSSSALGSPRDAARASQQERARTGVDDEKVLLALIDVADAGEQQARYRVLQGRRGRRRPISRGQPVELARPGCIARPNRRAKQRASRRTSSPMQAIRVRSFVERLWAAADMAGSGGGGGSRIIARRAAAVGAGRVEAGRAIRRSSWRLHIDRLTTRGCHLAQHGQHKSAAVGHSSHVSQGTSRRQAKPDEARQRTRGPPAVLALSRRECQKTAR